MKNTTKTKKRSWILRFLDKIEVAGNKLPTPLTIFFYLAVESAWRKAPAI